MESEAERVARNDATFRDHNEAIRARAAHLDGDSPELVPFLCECAELTCTSIVRLTLDEYEAVRARPDYFLNVDGHETAGGPYVRVVERYDRYCVVQKLGRAAELVEEMDPRGASERVDPA